VGGGGLVGVSGMCRSVRFSRLVSTINDINFTIEKIDKYSKLIEIVSSTCYESLSENNKFRVKVLNDLLKKQKLSSRPFIMYIDIHYDPEKNLILIDYPFYPKSSK
jgi:hypothetical protein